MIMHPSAPADPGTLVEATYDLPFTRMHTTIWAALVAHDVVEQHTQIEGAACIRVRVAATTLNLVVQALDDTHTIVRVHPMPTPYREGGAIPPPATSPNSIATARALLHMGERALHMLSYPPDVGAMTRVPPQMHAAVRSVLLWCRYFITVQTEPDELAVIDTMLTDLDILSWLHWSSTWKITDPPLREQALGASFHHTTRASSARTNGMTTALIQLNPSLAEEPCVVLDVESADSHGPVIEMAVIGLRSGAVCVHSRFGLPPHAAWSIYAERVHHIPRHSLAGLPTFAEQSDAILALLAGRIIIGHTIASDLALIRKSLVPPRELRIARAICTRMLAQTDMRLPQYTLATVAEACGTPLVDAHAALADTYATRAVYLHIRAMRARARTTA